jgi:hypothetical protein
MKQQVSRILSVGTGLTTLSISVWGLYLSWNSVSRYIAGDFDVLSEQHQVLHFGSSFFPMLTVTVGCCLVLLWCGLDQVRARLDHLKILVALFICEIAYLSSRDRGGGLAVIKYSPEYCSRVRRSKCWPHAAILFLLARLGTDYTVVG